MKLLCPAGQSQPVLLEPDGSLAITSPRPWWLMQLVLHLQERWGLELLQRLGEGDPLVLDWLGFEAWVYCQELEEEPLEIAAAEVF